MVSKNIPDILMKFKAYHTKKNGHKSIYNKICLERKKDEKKDI